MPASYTNLAFEGAGVRNIAQVGALRGLMEMDGFLDGITRIAGTSGGSMLGLAMALQYSPEEVINLMRDLNFRRFQSGWNPTCPALSTASYVDLSAVRSPSAPMNGVRRTSGTSARVVA
jgi:Predicted esterase of the alpha-beta hydrolase superfamily